MAFNGSFNTSDYRGKSLLFEWSVKSQDIVSNSTVISWTLKGYSASTGYHMTQNIKLTINDEVVYQKPASAGQIPLYNNTVVATGTYTFTHDEDGKCSFTAYAEAGIFAWEVNCTGSATFELPQILRASVPTLSVDSTTFGNEVTVYTNKKSSGFTHRLCYSVNGGDEVELATEVTDSFSWTIPYDLMRDVLNASEATITFKLYTYSGDKTIGENAVDLVVTVPTNENTMPRVTMTLSPESSLPSAFNGLYIQGKTKVKALISATGAYGASVNSCSMNVDGGVYGAEQAYTSKLLTKYGAFAVVGSAVDSRGVVGSVTQNIVVIAYNNPKVQDVQAIRCDSAGNANDSGTYLKISAKRSYSKVVANGEQKNFCAIRFRYRPAAVENFSEWSTILARDSVGSDEVVTGAMLNGTLSAQVTYVVQVQVIDDIGESSYTEIPISTEKVYWHRDGARNSFAFGGYVEEDDTFAIAEGIEFVVKSEKWVSLGLSGSVSQASGEDGRTESGCSYRVVNGNHVYVEFNCAVTYSGSAIAVSANALPSKYRPTRNAYSFCVPSGKAIACVSVAPSGYVYIEWIHDTSKTSTTSYSATWIDGYIDFFI